jgi:hypothetical protein
MAINDYNPPGVSVSELTTQSVTPGLSPAGVIAIVGEVPDALAHTSASFSKSLTSSTSGTNVTLSEVPANATDVSLISVTYVAANGVTTDIPSTGSSLKYTFTWSLGNAPQIKLLKGDGSDATYTVTLRINYTPANYFSPTLIRAYTDAENLYGLPLESGVGVSCPLTLGVKFAFENGARTVYALPIATADASDGAAWNDALNTLHSVPGLSIVVPVLSNSDNQTDIFAAVQEFQKTAAETYQNQVFTVLGEDGTGQDFATGVESLRTEAAAIRGASTGATYGKQAALVSPARFTRAVDPNNSYVLGGQYLAAAVGGMLAGRLPSRSITRQSVVGVSAIEYRSRPDLDDDAGSGLLVVYPNNGINQVRHSKTVDLGPSYDTEVSVVRAKGRMISSIRQTLEDQIIGQTIADDLAPATVTSAVVGILQLLQTAGEIVGFQDVQARLVTSDPTQMDVRFSYRPSFPLNYINVGFSINLAAATATLNTATTA